MLPLKYYYSGWFFTSGHLKLDLDPCWSKTVFRHLLQKECRHCSMRGSIYSLEQRPHVADGGVFEDMMMVYSAI